MARRKATWRQAELRITYGSELWVLVRHRRGTFRLPVSASIEQLLFGLVDGWDMSREGHNRERDPLVPDSRTLARIWERDTGESPKISGA